MARVYKVIVLPDLQIPYHDEAALSAVEKYMADERWDEWVQLGDFVDLDHLSKFSKDAARKLNGKSLEGDYAAGRKILDKHSRILRKKNPACKMTLIEGNHEIRVEKFIDANPQLQGSIEVERGLGLKERGIRWVRFWRDGDLHKIGRAYFGHGKYHGGNHAAKHVSNYGVNIFYGHTHDAQCVSKALWGRDATIVGQSLGCLCRYDLEYVGEHPTNWQQAFGVFWFRPGGFFNYSVVRIFDGEFVAPNGKVYRG